MPSLLGISVLCHDLAEIRIFTLYCGGIADSSRPSEPETGCIKEIGCDGAQGHGG